MTSPKKVIWTAITTHISLFRPNRYRRALPLVKSTAACYLACPTPPSVGPYLSVRLKHQGCRLPQSPLQPPQLPNHYDSTIFALATAPGKAAIAVIRVSGPASREVRWLLASFQYRKVF